MSWWHWWSVLHLNITETFSLEQQIIVHDQCQWIIIFYHCNVTPQVKVKFRFSTSLKRQDAMKTLLVTLGVVSHQSQVIQILILCMFEQNHHKKYEFSNSTKETVKQPLSSPSDCYPLRRSWIQFCVWKTAGCNERPLLLQ